MATLDSDFLAEATRKYFMPEIKKELFTPRTLFPTKLRQVFYGITAESLKDRVNDFLLSNYGEINVLSTEYSQDDYLHTHKATIYYSAATTSPYFTPPSRNPYWLSKSESAVDEGIKLVFLARFREHFLRIIQSMTLEEIRNMARKVSMERIKELARAMEEVKTNPLTGDPLKEIKWVLEEEEEEGMWKKVWVPFTTTAGTTADTPTVTFFASGTAENGT